ncbi:MAG: hypothetical protein GTO60_07410, partial [Gammaproteobacteria bacterium]|nr:hypothetical protein [Gammaproteobacteria bacterium]
MSSVLGISMRFFLILFLLNTSFNVYAQSVRVGTISSSINNWPLWIAQAKNMFDDEGLDVEVIITGESEHQLDMVDNHE